MLESQLSGCSAFKVWQQYFSTSPAVVSVQRYATAGCLLHRPTSVPRDFWAVWVTLRVCNIPVGVKVVFLQCFYHAIFVERVASSSCIGQP